MTRGAPVDVELLELSCAGHRLAFPGERVLRVLDADGWGGDAPVELAGALGVAGGERASRVLVVETASGSLPVAVHAVHGLTKIPASDVLPLPSRVRRHAPALAALAVCSAGQTLVIDPDALSIRPFSRGASP